MLQSFFRFFVFFVIILLFSYFIHLWCIEKFLPLKNINFLNFSYAYTIVYTIVLIVVIVMLQTKFKDQLSLIFLAGSFLKLGIFVALTKGIGIEMNTSVFLDFFIPYALSMILEVYYISKILKNLDV